MSVRLLSKPFFSVASMLLVVALTLGMSRNSQAAVATYTIDGGASTLSGQFFNGVNNVSFNNATFKFYGTADTSNITFDGSTFRTLLNMTFEINDGGNKTIATLADPWLVYSTQSDGTDGAIGFTDTNFDSYSEISSGSPASSPGIFNNLASNGKWFGNFLNSGFNTQFPTTGGGQFTFDAGTDNSQGAFFEISGVGGGAGGEVPEPTSMAIFGLGALGMAYRARRKSKA